jgi:DNA-binding ferritin-like protein (Dps family)
MSLLAGQVTKIHEGASIVAPGMPGILGKDVGRFGKQLLGDHIVELVTSDDGKV